MRQAVILAGGKGTRLASVVGGLPKPLVDVGGKPLLEYQLELLRAHGYAEVVLMVSHKVEHIRAWLEHVDVPISVKLIDDGAPRGTGGAVLAALDQLDPEFLVMYGDTMLWVDLTRFAAWHEARPGTDVSLFLHPNDHPQDSDLVTVDETGRILGFHSYPHPDGAWLPNLVNAALYIVRRDALLPWRGATPPLDFAKDLFPRMLAAGGRLRGYNSPEYIKDCGTPTRLERVRADLADGRIHRAALDRPQRAVFIDRDGTLNVERGLVRRAEDLEVFPFAGPAIRRLNDSEWRSVLISNQPVVARGETSPEELRRIQARLETEIGREHAYLDRTYLCPHHPVRGFAGEVAELKIDCTCRKPKPGMIFAARDELNIDLSASWYVGDSTADLGAAEQAGVSSILVETGHGGLDGRYPFEPKFTVPDFAAAVEFVLETYPALAARLKELTDHIEAGTATDWFVGGLSRIGKSNVSATIERELGRRGRRARVLHLDRWLLSDADRKYGVFGRFDMAGIEAVVRQAHERASGAVSLALPAYDRKKRLRIDRADGIEVQPGEIIVWDGVVANELAMRLGAAERSIFVTGDESARRERFVHYYFRRGVDRPEAAELYAARASDEHEMVTRVGETVKLRVTLDGIRPASQRSRETRE